MSYFLTKLSSLSYTASSLDVGQPIHFTAQSSLETINYSILKPQDFVAVYYEDPINKINAIWQVVGNITENTFSFNKVCEVSVGADLNPIYMERLERFNLVELNESDFKKIKEELHNHVLDLLYTENINNNKLYQRIVFGAPGTGKSYKLNVEAIEAFPTVRDDFLVLKQAILKAKDDPDDKIIKALKLGLRYSAVVNKIFDNKTRTQEEIKTQFQLTENDFSDRQWQELVSVAKALSYKNSNFRSCIERVTFHPNYSYAQFVGTYKPIQNSEKGKEYEILYKYVPGPFMRTLVKALQQPEQDFLLIIEEINRANVAAIFGDVFQLLDRKNGVSEYPIAASEDIRNFLADNGINEKELCIPSNMYIWATMNSADQGVFPMDTAFKRRWEFEYIGIDDNAEKVANYEIPIGRQGDKAKWKVKWDELRRSINNKLISLGINEDKLLGPYFLSESVLESAMDKGVDFVKSFESKVLMYLFEDAAKMKVRQLFKITSEKYIYSEVCKEFEEKGVEVFALEKYPNVVDIASSES